MTDDALKEHLVRYIASQGQDFSLPSGFVVPRRLSRPAVVLCEHMFGQGLRAGQEGLLAFALALELDVEQTRELLARAGYALSPNERFDLAVEFFIRAGLYDIMKINEYLKELDLPLFGYDPDRQLSPDRRP